MAAGDIPGGQGGSVPAAPAALYRRYRPATFAELRGQEHISEPLSQALRNGRVHHAYLFSGPRGCGKTSSARILARALNCEQGPTPEPCGTCESCVALAPSGPGSLDVIEIDAASHGGVDDARDLRERAFYAPVAGRFKIYIVDEAHMVTREGFNALLKLVEEPPPHLKFVFATTEPEKVIATIRSRTHHYAFRLIPPAVLRGLLESILDAEGVSYEAAVLPVVIRAAAGSARDALSVLDQLLAGSGPGGLTYERAAALLGYTDDRLLDEVTEAFAAGDGAAVFRAVDRVVEGGHEPRRFAVDLLDRLRDLIILAAVPDAGSTGLLDVPGDRLDRMRDQSAAFGQARLAQAAGTINAGLAEMRGATSPRLQLELMCAQVLLPAGESAADVAALAGRVERLERLLTAQPAAGTAGAVPAPASPPRAAPRPSAAASLPAAPPPAAPPSAAPRPSAVAQASPSPAPAVAQAVVPGSAPAPAAPPRADAAPGAGAAPQPPGGSSSAGADVEGIRRRWPEILEAVKGQRRVAWMLLSNASPDSLQDGVLTLQFASEGEARGFIGSGYDADLKAVLARLAGISPQIRTRTAGTGGTARPGSPGRQPRPADQDAPADDSDPAGPAGTGDPGSPAGLGGLAGQAGPADAGAAGSRADQGGPAGYGAGPGGGARPSLGARGQLAGEPEDSGLASSELVGMDLIQRELGGRIIGEITE